MNLVTWVKTFNAGSDSNSAFASAMIADPFDQVNYGVYADYLEENGNYDEARAYRYVYDNFDRIVDEATQFVRDNYYRNSRRNTLQRTRTFVHEIMPGIDVFVVFAFSEKVLETLENW